MVTRGRVGWCPDGSLSLGGWSRPHERKNLSSVTCPGSTWLGILGQGKMAKGWLWGSGPGLSGSISFPTSSGWSTTGRDRRPRRKLRTWERQGWHSFTQLGDTVRFWLCSYPLRKLRVMGFALEPIWLLHLNSVTSEKLASSQGLSFLLCTTEIIVMSTSYECVSIHWNYTQCFAHGKCSINVAVVNVPGAIADIPWLCLYPCSCWAWWGSERHSNGSSHHRNSSGWMSRCRRRRGAFLRRAWSQSTRSMEVTVKMWAPGEQGKGGERSHLQEL